MKRNWTERDERKLEWQIAGGAVALAAFCVWMAVLAVRATFGF